MTTLSDFVDIGGECFNVTGTSDSPPLATEANNTKSYDLVCKSKKEFDKTFRSILVQDDIRLIRTYLPYQQPQLQGIQESEKEPLKKFIQKRMDMLKVSSENTNRSIKNMQFDRYYEKLEKLLEEIGHASSTSPITSLPDLQKRIKYKFPKSRVYYVLMELAWYLLHPDMIVSNSDSWMKLLDTVETLNLGAIMKTIHETTPHDMRIDMDHVEKATALNQSVVSPPDASVELKKRLESILKLFKMRKYLHDAHPSNNKGPVVNDETIGLLTSRLPMSMKGGSNTNSKNAVSNSFKINSESVASMMKPFYDFFKQKYNPITSILSKNPLPDGLSLVSLSKLLFICQKIMSQSPIKYGVYRITNMDPVMMEFLRNQLGAVQTHIKEIEVKDEDVKTFTDMASFVPIVSITSLLNRFGKSGHYTDPESLPAVRIMIKGINLEHRKDKPEHIASDIDKEKFDNALSDFFTDQAIYLVCNETKSTQTPMNVIEIDYSTVNATKNVWAPNELKKNYFNTYKTPPLYLETVMDVKSNVVYNHGMLALSMFIASEELLPK
jgi:hypothetical protein